MKLDLGCGKNKQDGFFGIDIKPLPGVDLVWDLNQGIPLPDQSVERVMISRVAPYIEQWETLLREIYRVCIHKSVICILAPYAHSFRHMSNPQFKHRFDEHSPRYWTSHFFQPPLSPASPPLSFYGEELCPPYDFRLLRMELFYAENFRPPLYDREELEMLLSLQANVADEIMYHLVVVKEEITAAELEQLSRQTHEEPPYTAGLRLEGESVPENEDPPSLTAINSPSPEMTGAVAAKNPPTSLPRFRKKASRSLRNRKKRSRFHH